MVHNESLHIASDGAEIFWQEWLPESDPRAVMILVHGLGEHSTRYAHLADKFTEAGIAVFTLDNRGHGKTPGTRGVMDFDKVVTDIGERLEEVRDRYPDAPVIVFGHSLGGLLTMTYTVRNKPAVTAQIASAPALDSELREQRLKFALANLLGGIVPDIVLPTGLDSSGVSRDPKVVAAYDADPLVHDKGSTGLAKATFAAMDDMMAQTTFPVPLLIVHGTDDRLTVPAASKTFVNQVTGDVTLIEYEGIYHELHNEPEQDEVFADIMQWLDQHLSS